MQDSYLDEKWQIPFEESADQMLKRKNCSFCPNIKPEYWGKAGQNLPSLNRRLSVSPFPGPTWKHSPMFYLKD